MFTIKPSSRTLEHRLWEKWKLCPHSCMQIFTATLFTAAPNWQWPCCPSMDDGETKGGMSTPWNTIQQQKSKLPWYNNLDVEWKKPILAWPILEDSVYIIFKKWQKCRAGNQIGTARREGGMSERVGMKRQPEVWEWGCSGFDYGVTQTYALHRSKHTHTHTSETGEDWVRSVGCTNVVFLVARSHYIVLQGIITLGGNWVKGAWDLQIIS